MCDLQKEEAQLRPSVPKSNQTRREQTATAERLQVSDAATSAPHRHPKLQSPRNIGATINVEHSPFSSVTSAQARICACEGEAGSSSLRHKHRGKRPAFKPQLAAQAWRHEKDKLHETRREQVEAHSIATSTKSTFAVGADDLAKRTLRWQREREEALKVNTKSQAAIRQIPTPPPQSAKSRSTSWILLEVVPLQDPGDHMASAHNV